MSVATAVSVEELDAPVFDIPDRARRAYPERPLASVTHLYQPAPRSVSGQLRLTHRGVVALSTLVGLVAAAIIGIAWASAPSSAGGATGAASTPANVSVQQGDSLWSIAERVAPNTDPRVEVERLQQLNHLAGVALQPGQLLRTR